MSAWYAAEQEWRAAPVDREQPDCIECGRAVVNRWTGNLRQGMHDRCWAERNGLEADRYVLGLPQADGRA